VHRIRPATLDDATAWAAVVQAASPHLVLDAGSEAHEMRTDPPDARRAVCEVDGRVVGVARLRVHDGEDDAGVQVMVDPFHRRRGLGSALVAWLEPLLEASGRQRATAIVEDDDGSRVAAERWGYRLTRSFQKVAVDPSRVAEPGPVPPGHEVVAVDAVGPHAIWEAHQQVARDDPSGLTLPQPYDEWRAGWDDPRARPDLGRAVLVDGELAAYTLVGAAEGRAWSDMTGTLPAHRGRGLALLVKQHALRACAGAGIELALTGNDRENLPMVAVNSRLGYQLVASPALAERVLR
jgi:GNAT superfamily N-acetyltransferase